ncbi:hypothetical protein C3L33_15119, partial [Rhododendron williamsianum]
MAAVALIFSPTTTTARNNYPKAGKIEDARKVFSTILAKGLKPNVKIYNTMISGLCKEALLDEAEELLLQMEGDGCPPDDVTYNIVVRAFLKSGDKHKIKILLQEIINRKFSPDVSTMLNYDIMNFSPDACTMSMLVDLLTDDVQGYEMFEMIQKLVPMDKM